MIKKNITKITLGKYRTRKNKVINTIRKEKEMML